MAGVERARDVFDALHRGDKVADDKIVGDFQARVKGAKRAALKKALGQGRTAESDEPVF